MAVTDVGSHQFRAGYTCGPTPPARRRHPLPSQQLRQHTVRTCRAFIFKYKWKKVWPRRTVVCMFIHDTNHGRHDILPSQHRNSSTPFACNFWFPASNKCTVYKHLFSCLIRVQLTVWHNTGCWCRCLLKVVFHRRGLQHNSSTMFKLNYNNSLQISGKTQGFVGAGIMKENKQSAHFLPSHFGVCFLPSKTKLTLLWLLKKTGWNVFIISTAQYINECFERACAAAVMGHDLSSSKTLCAKRYGPI